MTNVWVFSGSLGQDSELTRIPSGTAILKFSVASNKGWGDRKQTTWVECSLWGKRGEAMESMLKKGQKVVITGEAGIETWDKNDGSKGYKMTCEASDVTLTGDKSQNAPAEPQQANNAPAGRIIHGDGASLDLDDEIPF